MCNDGMCIPCVCDRDSNCLFLCKISSYGRNTNGVKYFTSCGDRTDLDFWNYDPCTGIFSGKSYRSSTDQLDTGWYFYRLYLSFIEKEKRPDHCHAVCGCAKCDWKLFHFIGNFNEIPYEIKKPSGQDHTAAEGKFVAEATRRRRRILQSRILSCGNINDESGKSINKTIGSDRFE